MDWDKLRIFHAVAEQESITHAGETLHLSQSAVSRQIHALEVTIGARLFHRHPRGLILTSEGEILFETTRDMLNRLNAATGEIRGVREGVYGVLRVTTTTDFGLLWLTPRLPRLFAEHPGLVIDLVMTEEVLDLPMRAADVAIRQRRPKQADVIAREICTASVGLYASRAYLDQAGTPARFEDLARHSLIGYSQKSPQPAENMDWLFMEKPGEVALKPRVIMNTQMGIREAARADVGIGILSDHLASGAGLVHVLPKIKGPKTHLHFVYASEMRRSKRVAILKKFIDNEMEDSKQAI